MSITATETKEYIDFVLESPESVLEVKENTYRHCDFRRLIMGYHTPIGYSGVKGV